ncbi:hypothetical protein [Halalkaliarchaeum desulfuricum]|nr:hypothetical protein [Halalkaliarchaeum desulfuricum]
MGHGILVSHLVEKFRDDESDDDGNGSDDDGNESDDDGNSSDDDSTA